MPQERRCAKCGSIISEREGSVMVGSNDGGKYMHLRCWDPGGRTVQREPAHPPYSLESAHAMINALRQSVEQLVIQNNQLEVRVAGLEAFIETVKRVTIQEEREP